MNNIKITQRPIKFRIYDKKINKFLDIQDLGIYNSDNIGDDFIAQQYVGFNDNEGKELFEGDFILFDERPIGGYKGVGVIIYSIDMCLDGPSFNIWVLDPKDPKMGLGFAPFPFDAKVIGNIMETDKKTIDFTDCDSDFKWQKK